jgi:hypothetical protein
MKTSIQAYDRNIEVTSIYFLTEVIREKHLNQILN